MRYWGESFVRITILRQYYVPYGREGTLPIRMQEMVAEALALSYERATWNSPPYRIAHNTYERDKVVLVSEKYDREKVVLAVTETVNAGVKMLAFLEGALPALHDDGPFQVALLDTIKNFGFVLGEFLNPLWLVQSPGLFMDIKQRIATNRAAASTQLLGRDELAEGKTVDPKDHPGTPQEIVRAYLTGTPFQKLFDG